MKKEKPTTKLCKHCKTEIPYDAKVCPQCNKKQGGNKLVTAAIVIVALGAISSVTSRNGSSNTTSNAVETAAESSEKNNNEWSEVAALNLDDDTILSIYNDYESAWTSSPEDPTKQSEYEDQVSQEIGNKYGISSKDADLVYMYVIANYDAMMAEKGADISDIKLKHGTLLDVTTNGGSIVLKAKIESNLTNNLTVQGCYFDVYEAIRNYGLNQYDELQYWAVADMTDGSEQKVVSFTVPKDVLEKVANGIILENQLIDNVSDAWLSPALQ